MYVDMSTSLLFTPYANMWWILYLRQSSLVLHLHTFYCNPNRSAISSDRHWKGWPYTLRVCLLFFWRSGDSDLMDSNETWSIQTNDLKMNSSHSLVRYSALLEYGKDWLAQCQHNVMGWDIRSWYWEPGRPVGQQHNITMTVGTHPDKNLDGART